MCCDLAKIKTSLKKMFDTQMELTARWHDCDASAPLCGEEINLDTLKCLVVNQHFHNFTLWHTEDIARRTDIDDSVIAQCKRSIDKSNQQRNDYIEKVDDCLAKILLPLLPKTAADRYNTETPGMAIDRLSILALKIFHMEEQTKRQDADEAHRLACQAKLDVLLVQRQALITSLLELLDEYHQGIKSPTAYYQFKMYNDPSLNPELYTHKNAS